MATINPNPDFIKYPHTPDHYNFFRTYRRALQAATREHNPTGERQPARGKFLGLVKLHGTNAGIVVRKPSLEAPVSEATRHFQSRNREITQQADNAGTFSHLNSVPVVELVEQVTTIRGCGLAWQEIIIAGEAAGFGIMKGVAVAHVPRFFAVFNVRIDGEWQDMRKYASVMLKEHRVFNIASWPTYEMEMDLDQDDFTALTTTLMSMTNEVVKSCPVGVALQSELQPHGGRGPPQTGEGIVWTMVESTDPAVPTLDRRTLINFKVKGEAFFTSTRKPPALPASDEITRASQFAEYACGERRFEQGVEFVQDHLVQAGTPDASPYQKRLIPVFTKWVVDDAMREEEITLIEMVVQEGRARTALFAAAKKWFVEKCEEV